MNYNCDSIYTTKSDLVIMVKSLAGQRKRNKRKIKKYERILELMIKDKFILTDYIKKVNEEFDLDMINDQLQAEGEALNDEIAFEKMSAKDSGISMQTVKLKKQPNNDENEKGESHGTFTKGKTTKNIN